MLQDRALGNPGGSACVLKEGDLVGTKLRLVQQHPLASGDRCIERRGARQRIGRNHLLRPPYDEIDYGALHHAQQVAHGGDDDVLDVGLGNHLLQRVREVFEHDDRLGGGPLELQTELPRRIQGIRIHHGIPGPQNADEDYGILQHIGHHDGDASALLQALTL
jgi:hypothetical protein